MRIGAEESCADLLVFLLLLLALALCLNSKFLGRELVLRKVVFILAILSDTSWFSGKQFQSWLKLCLKWWALFCKKVEGLLFWLITAVC